MIASPMAYLISQVEYPDWYRKSLCGFGCNHHICVFAYWLHNWNDIHEEKHAESEAVGQHVCVCFSKRNDWEKPSEAHTETL